MFVMSCGLIWFNWRKWSIFQIISMQGLEVDSTERFYEVIHLLNSFNHPNITTLYLISSRSLAAKKVYLMKIKIHHSRVMGDKHSYFLRICQQLHSCINKHVKEFTGIRIFSSQIAIELKYLALLFFTIIRFIRNLCNDKLVHH